MNGKIKPCKPVKAELSSSPRHDPSSCCLFHIRLIPQGNKYLLLCYNYCSVYCVVILIVHTINSLSPVLYSTTVLPETWALLSCSFWSFSFLLKNFFAEVFLTWYMGLNREGGVQVCCTDCKTPFRQMCDLWYCGIQIKSDLAFLKYLIDTNWKFTE